MSPEKLTASVRRLMKRAAPAVPLFVLYNIPFRDHGNHSAGGAEDEHEYIQWVQAFADGLEGFEKPIVIIEPDALPLAHGDKKLTEFRVRLIGDALRILKDCKTYVDVGHPRWLSADDAAGLLGMIKADFTGFSVNVSNFVPLNECVAWGDEISKRTGWKKKFVIDTSRNGSPNHDGTWCNPRGKLLGHPPTLDTAYHNVDALLWVKIPGESDGYGNGGPKAGVFWPEYAMMLLGEQGLP
jgi:endoglucanase